MKPPIMGEAASARLATRVDRPFKLLLGKRRPGDIAAQMTTS